MKLKFHGGAEQIGRSCIELITFEGRYLLDAGLWITDHGAEFPSEIENLEEIDAILISHAHLDHTGALPLLEHNGLKCNVFSSKGNKEIIKLLLKDSYKISKLNHEHVIYNKYDIDDVMNMFIEINYKEENSIKDIKFSFHSAGHIPGSSSILIENNGKKLLYTGDVNFSNTRLLEGADLNFIEIDYLITEATYGNRNHPSREEQEKLFKETVVNTIDKNGIALISAFAVGRSQEILLILNDLDIKVPIYLDGMSKQVTNLFKQNFDLIKDKEAYNNFLSKIKFIESHNDRKKIINESCIIISTSGMVNGGPIIYYLKELYNNENNSIILTGYQAEGTNGRNISEKKPVILDEEQYILKMQSYHFDFSAHSGLDELKEMILKLSPKKVIVQHGDKDAIHDLCSWIEEKGMEAYSPILNSIIDLEEV